MTVEAEAETVDPDDIEAQIEAALRASMQLEEEQVDSTIDTDSLEDQAADPPELDAEPTEPEPVDSVEDAVITAEDQQDIAAYFRSSGIEPDLQTAQQLVQMRQWYDSLSQTEIDAVNGALSSLREGKPAEPAPEPVSTPQPVLQIPGLDMFDDDERAAFGSAITDYIQSSVAPLQSELAEYQAERQRAAQERNEQENRMIETGIDAGQALFTETHPELTEVDIARITDEVVQKGIWATHYAAAGNDPQAATVNAYEQILLSDDDLRSRFIAAQLQAERDKTLIDDERKENLAALGGGGSPAASDTVNSQERKYDDPLAEAIAEAQRNLV